MNFKQIQCVIKLAETRSFSAASESLDISQPALSKQVLSLERELGVKLIDRNTIPIGLTMAGQQFVREMQGIYYRKEQLVRSLEQYKTEEKGRLVVGVSPFRNLYQMPAVIRKIKAKYPDVQIDICEMSSDQLRKNAVEGHFDFAIVNLPVDELMLDVRYLKQESIMLAVPDAMVSLLERDPQEASDSVSFSQCRNLPFVVVAQPQEMRRCFDGLCMRCDVAPKISMEVSGGITTAWAMARAGLGATLLPMQFEAESRVDDNLSFFSLNDISYVRQPVLVTRKGQHIGEVAQYALDLLQNQ